MKKIVSSIIGLIIVFLMYTNVQGASTINADVGLNREELTEGQEVVVTLKFNNYQKIEKGINAYKATLKYDKEVFEEVTQIDFTELNGWEKLEYNKETGEFVAIKKAGSIAPEEIVNIILKVKKNAPNGKTVISIKDIVVSEGKEDIQLESAERNITIIKKQSQVPETTTGNNNNINQEIKNDSEATTQNQNVHPGKIPKTGMNYTIWLILIIIAMVLVIFSAINIKKIRDKEKKVNKKSVIIIIIASIAISIQFLGVVYAAVSSFSSKGELNDDGVINYVDVNLLELYLIHLRELPNEKLENADMNSDGKITVTDLTLLVQKIENKLEYEVNLSNMEIDKYYPNKNEEITLKFVGEASYEASIKEVTINGQSYPAKMLNDSKYEISLNVGNIAGIKDYHITEVLLNTGKKVKVNYNLKIDVLKELPTIENYVTDDDINESKVNLSFDLIDVENSITSANIQIINDAEETIQNERITKGKNKIDVNVEDGKKYKVQFWIEYNLATDELSEHPENHSGIIQFEKEIEFVIDYNFTLSNIKALKDGTDKTDFEKNDEIQISFESSNNTKFEVDVVKINGKEYEVTKQDNKYGVTIDGYTEFGEKQITIEEVKLENGKKFTLENKTLVVNIIKQKPSILNFESEEETKENKLKVKFNLKDEDETIKSARIVLLNNKGNEIDTKTIEAGNVEEVLSTSLTSSYTVKIIATYDQTGKEEVESVIFEKTIEAKACVNITNATINNDYVEKGKNIKILYNVETNKIEDVTKIRVNDIECIAIKLSNNTYEVTYTVDKTSGIKELTTTKMTFSDGTVADVNNVNLVEVLKDAPTVEAIKEHDDLDNSEIKLDFNLIDNDEAFISGKAILTKLKNVDGIYKVDETYEAQEVTIQVGENSKTFEVEEGKVYKLTIFATYDRDTNSLEEKPNEDNLFTNRAIKEIEIELISDYNLKVNDIQTYNAEGQQTKYFNKNEKIDFKFTSTNNSIFVPVNAVINGKEYNLTREGNTNIYQAQIDAYEDSGIKEIVIEEIILNNTIRPDVTEDNQTKIEILKDIPSISEFSYVENEDNTIKTSFELIDREGAVTNAILTITDEFGKIIISEGITSGVNEITFNKTSSENYYLKVVADYDLDTNSIETGKNEYKDEVLLEEEINVSDRMIEMKDITNIYLYKQNEDSVDAITNINIADLANLSNYIVKVEMKDIPTFYSEIKEYKVEDGVLKFVLDYDKIVQYDGKQKHNYLEVEYGIVENEIAKLSELSILIQQIAKNPAGSYKLTADLDARNTISSSSVIFPTTFTGTLDGNGHKITNMTGTLFNKISAGTVKNLKIENTSTKQYGILANTIENGSKIENVVIKNAQINNGLSSVGTFTGIITNSTIQNSAAIDISIVASNTIGGIAGEMKSNSVVQNCYVTGKIRGTLSHNLGSRVGGITGWDSGKAINNCFTKVDITSPDKKGNGGIIGGPSGANPSITNSISMSTGTAYKIAGFDVLSNANNVYEYEKSNSTTNINDANKEKVKIATEEKVKDRNFYIDELGWSTDIWTFDRVENGANPTLKGADSNYIGNLYIPDYSRLKELSDYDETKEIAYHNLYKLMPFYDAKYLLVDGGKIARDHILNTKIVKQVLPYDKNGKLIVALSQDMKNTIKTIKIVFEDDSVSQYSVTYKDSFASVTNYKIDELGIEYNYNKYLIDTSSKTYTDLVAKVRALDYTNNIQIVTEEEEVRNFTDNYDHVKQNAEEFALNFLANNGDYTISTQNTVLENKINQDLTNNQMLEKILYTYNYFDRFYNIEIGGINMRDIIFFDGSIFNKNLNSIKMTQTLIGANPSERTIATNINSLPNYYNNRVKPYTGKSLGLFLEYFIKNLTEEKYKNDPASWIIDNFEGTIYEAPAVGTSDTGVDYTKIRYRVWDHLKARELLILPILSYHGDDMYVLGIPTTILVGNMRRYFSNYNAATDAQKLAKLKEFAAMSNNLYGTIAGVVNSNVFNTMCNKTHISYDTTQGKNWSTSETIEPVYKAFNEVLNVWPYVKGASAYANGNDIYWIYEALKYYAIFTHEAVHNQDGYLFLESKWRRAGANAELYTDGFLTQAFGENGVLPNYTYNYKMTDKYATNLTAERINTREKIDSYYNNMFEVLGIMEYLEGQAFLRLTPEQQSKLAVKLSGTSTVKAEDKTAEEIKAMNLKTMEDLWDNQLVILRGGSAYIGSSYWHIIHNDDGLVQKSYFILTACQMLGSYGYTGFVGYASNQYGSDLKAIRGITGNNDMTWKQYQMDKYARIEQKLKDITYFDADEMIETMKTAMQYDIINGTPRADTSYEAILRKTIYGYIKRATNDFRTSIYQDVADPIHISSAEEFMQKLNGKINANIILDNDIDFSNINVDTATIIGGTFTGTIDGKGHKITGLKKPLFTNLIYTDIKNLSIENSSITTSSTQIGAFAKYLQYGTIENVNLNNVKVSGTNKIGGLIGQANQVFVTGCKITETTVTGTQNEVGGLFGYVNYSTVKNVHTVNTNITATNGRAGNIIGMGEYLFEVSECIGNGTVNTSKNATGGIIGQTTNSRILNSYSLGTVKGTMQLGGIVGYAKNTIIMKCFSNATIESTSSNNCGGLVGVAVESTTIKDNITFGNAINAYKFDGGTANALFTANYANNYEYEESMGISTLNRTGINFEGKISVAYTEDIAKVEFYKNTLGWDSNIWDFTNVLKGGLPKLKNSDSNNVTSIIEKVEVDSVEDFLKIQDAPNKYYTITKDIDFSKYTGTGSVITADFVGKIQGNGHTLSGLTDNTLFKSFKGTVENLNIKDFSNTRNADTVTAFADTTNNAVLKNMKFENITLSGTHRTAVVVGTDSANSEFEHITVKNANVIGSGVYVSTFIGRKYGGKIVNCYVEGTLECYTTECGGIIGALQSGGKIENVVANVNVNRPRSTDSRNKNGGFIGNIYDSPTIKNSISIGNMTGFTDNNGNNINVNKFTGCTEANIKTYFENCYEKQESTGTSSVTENTKGHLDIATSQNLLDKNFYKNILKFDAAIWNLDILETTGHPELK